MKSLLAKLMVVFAVTALVAGCGEKDKPEGDGAGNGAAGAGEGGGDGGGKTAKSDIVDTAVAAGDFGTLVAAVKAADLIDTLKGEGPFTVFAPTDAAFAKLPEGTVEDLLKPENKEKLAGILTYHVVAGKVMAADVVKLEKAKTVQGSEATVKVDGETVMIDGATVVKTDIECSNGVIHVIDTVIMPK